jgi:hypothetical protein
LTTQTQHSPEISNSPAPAKHKGVVVAAMLIGAGGLLASILPLLGQSSVKPLATIEADVQAFAIAPDNQIAYAVQRMKRIKKLTVEHDDFWVATIDGKKRKIIDGDKFTPQPFETPEPDLTADSAGPQIPGSTSSSSSSSSSSSGSDDRSDEKPAKGQKGPKEKKEKAPLPPQHSYQVDTITWSPDSKRLVIKMDTSNMAQPQGSIVQQLDEQQTVRPNTILYLMDAEGRDIPITGSKTPTLADAFNAAWLADGVTLVYMNRTTGGAAQMMTLRPSEGKSRVLFDGHLFTAVSWDTKRNQAFALEENTRVVGPPKIVQLDLVGGARKELAAVDEYAGFLSISPSAKKIAYFKDGDTLEVRDLANGGKVTQVRVAIGEFQWSHDEQRVLLKRGEPAKSADLVWVGLYNNAFDPFFHGLEFHEFEIAPDGQTIAVTEPGRRDLTVYRFE